MPWPKRQRASRKGAVRPMDSNVGSAPIVTVEIPMVSSAATSVVFLPIRSPKCPNSADPIGRATNAMPNVASEARVAVAGSDAGKKSRGNTSTAAVA